VGTTVGEGGHAELAGRDFVGRKISQLDTPALLVDLDTMEQNLRTMAHFFQKQTSKLRPHFKNHRVIEFAHKQTGYGAIGITCARLWQAEKLVNAGVKNILIANELAGEIQLRRFVGLSKEAPVVLAVDSPVIVRDLARLARHTPAQLNVVVDVDLGLKRCGVPSTEAAVSLARTVVESGIHLAGVMGYEGHLQPLPPGPDKDNAVRQAVQRLIDAKRKIEEVAIPISMVSCGGTGDYNIAGTFPGVTENQAGSYLLMDTWYAPFAPDFHPALSVLATVISKTAGDRIVADAGVKALSGERGLPAVKNCPGLKLKALHAEHAPIEIMDSQVRVRVGDKIEIAVHYHDGTIHLHRKMYGIRNGQVERVFGIEHDGGD
jgi:D-serine deaminase-like pyridoxal phosphate-dependent protein